MNVEKFDSRWLIDNSVNESADKFPFKQTHFRPTDNKHHDLPINLLSTVKFAC
jgi:hypothetical protein